MRGDYQTPGGVDPASSTDPYCTLPPEDLCLTQLAEPCRTTTTGLAKFSAKKSSPKIARATPRSSLHEVDERAMQNQNLRLLPGPDLIDSSLTSFLDRRFLTTSTIFLCREETWSKYYKSRNELTAWRNDHGEAKDRAEATFRQFSAKISHL